jgi:alpha-tubulin suppressor-like RCC1 family protein
MRRAIFLAMALSGCGLHLEVLSDREISDTSVQDVQLDDGVFDGAEDDAPMGTGEDLALGQYHSCAIQRGALFCWGDNIDGALGLGDTVARNVPTRVRFAKAFVAVTGGENFTCARTEAGEVYCFGTNADNELGLGDTERRLTPTLVTLPRPAKLVVAGLELACAILDDDSLHCWGSNVEGQIGQDDFPPIPASRPLRVGTFNDWQKIAPGQGHVCGIRAPGTLWCWGVNTLGQAFNARVATICVPRRVDDENDFVEVSVVSF